MYLVFVTFTMLSSVLRYFLYSEVQFKFDVLGNVFSFFFKWPNYADDVYVWLRVDIRTMYVCISVSERAHLAYVSYDLCWCSCK